MLGNTMSDDIFQIYCKSCGSRLNAKANLIGQTRNCPKCKTPILIQHEEPSATKEVPTTPIIINEPSITEFAPVPTLDEGAGLIENLPERLAFRNRYIILGAERVVAVWETGKGWQINVGGGFSPAKKNISAIPDQGSFVLVEIVIDSVAGDSMIGGGPKSLNIFKISQRGALTSLYRDESEILEKVDCATELSPQQKNALLSYIRQHFMFESLAGSQELLESLSMP